MRYLIFAALLGLLAAPVQAQSEEYVYAKLNSGVTIPQGPEAYRAVYGGGPGFGLSVAYGLSFGVEFAVHASYALLGVDEALFLADRGFPELEADADLGPARYYGASVESRFYFGRRYGALYVHGGGGIRRLSLPGGTAIGPAGPVDVAGVVRTGPALSAGLGLMIPVARKFGLFAEAGYEALFADGEWLYSVPVKAGVAIQLSDSY